MRTQHALPFKLAAHTRVLPARAQLTVGDASVGKTSLTLRWADDVFTESFMATIGVDFRIKTMECDNGGRVKVQLWDTAGQERFRTITSSYYRGADGILLVYDVCCRVSFEHCGVWLTELRRHAQDGIALCLAGNKSDLARREVSEGEGAAFAAEHDLPFFEMSARDSTNVDKVYTALVVAAMGGALPPPPPPHGAMPCAEAPVSVVGNAGAEAEVPLCAALSVSASSSGGGIGATSASGDGGGGGSGGSSSSSSSSSSSDDDD